MLFYATILFARNDLEGMDELQEKLVRRVVGIAFIGDVSLEGFAKLTLYSLFCESRAACCARLSSRYTILLATLPTELLLSPSRWNETLWGLVFVPLVGMAWKVIWLLGIGRATAM